MSDAPKLLPSIEGVHALALEAAPNGVVVCDGEGTILLVNRQVELIFGYSRNELAGSGMDILVPERFRAAHARERAQYWRDPTSRPMGTGRELSGRRKDGSEVPVEVGLISVAGDDGPLVIASVVDVTERWQLRRDLERAAAKRLEFEGEVARVAARFVDVPAHEVDGAITDSLRRIVEALDVDWSVLWRFTEDGVDLRSTHAWTRPEYGRHPTGISVRQSFPWSFEQLRANRALWYDRVDTVPSTPDRESLENLNTKSNAVIPLSHDGQVAGAISFGARHEMSWSPEIRERIMLLAAVFAQALARKKNQEQLRQALSDVERLRDQLALENVQLRHEVKTLRGTQMIAAASASVREILTQIESVARTDATVLLLGETGTGKEVFAQAIHEMSGRHGRPMVRVNCAAIPTALMESELFGRERGAYTGALSRQIGRFELADGSTIFLDEVGDLAPEAQVKILRVIQDKVLERLGSTRPIKVDVRIIAATNRDLEQAVANRSFRDDLYYRLNVFPITVPPLRERVADIPVLVWTFVEEFARTFNKKIESISRDSVTALQRHSWPGNVRELRNVIERAVIVAKGPRLVIELPQAVPAEAREAVALSDVEAGHIRDVLQRVGWRVRGRGGASEILGMKPTTLESRMAKLGIRRPRG